MKAAEPLTVTWHGTAKPGFTPSSHLLTESETTLQSSGQPSGELWWRLWANWDGRRNTVLGWALSLVLFIISRYEIITGRSVFLSHDPFPLAIKQTVCAASAYLMSCKTKAA